MEISLRPAGAPIFDSKAEFYNHPPSYDQLIWALRYT